jgi:hypothetical protein
LSLAQQNTSLPQAFAGWYILSRIGLPHSTFPVVMPNGFTYHPQNEALLQWFEFQSPSDALDGAYSYPDTTILTHPSAPQNAKCAP